jgi:predicted Zn-dependent protease
MKSGRGSSPIVRMFGLALICLLGVECPGARAADREKAAAAYREGNGLYDQNHFGEAVAAYDRAIAEDPQYAEAYHNRALANEMVDRQKAIQDWRRFVEIAADQPTFKYDAARAVARIQMLEALPPFPGSLQPSRYVSSAGDYYWNISQNSEGEEWPKLPVKVFLGNAPEVKWQEGAREAYNLWAAVFPVEIVALPKDADIRMGWEEAMRGMEHAGEEIEWVQIRRVGGQLTGRKVAVIAIDVHRRWSRDEMRAIVLHEMGHALGIKGHSDSQKDIMYWQFKEKEFQVPVPVIDSPLIWKMFVKQPSQRDINTLIRLYNSAGSGKRFR